MSLSSSLGRGSGLLCASTTPMGHALKMLCLCISSSFLCSLVHRSCSDRETTRHVIETRVKGVEGKMGSVWQSRTRAQQRRYRVQTNREKGRKLIDFRSCQKRRPPPTLPPFLPRARLSPSLQFAEPKERERGAPPMTILRF